MLRPCAISGEAASNPDPGTVPPHPHSCAVHSLKPNLSLRAAHDRLAAKDGEIGKDGLVLQPHLSQHRLSRPQQLCSPDQLWAMYIYALYHRTQPYVGLPQLLSRYSGTALDILEAK